MKRPASAASPADEPPAKTRVARGSSNWQEVGSLHFCDYGGTPSAKVAAFDLDDTLIATKSGKTFAESPTDWRWWHPKVPEKLRALAADGTRLVVMSNQSGIGKGTADKSAHRQKVDAVQKELGLPLLVLVATGDDQFRKPRTGMWDWLSSRGGGGIAAGIKPLAAKSFFVGDAAGRPELKKPKTKKDFSDSDLKLSLNLGVEFWTPDRFFLGPDADRQRPVPTSFAFDPRQLGKKKNGAVTLKPTAGQEVVVMVGPPGSGKSSASKQCLPGYVHVNQDTLKTKEKCVALCKASLSSGKSVVIDNQNKDKATRKLYVDAAKAAGVPARAVLVDVPKELCFHLNVYRSINANSPEHRGADKVPSMVIHSYFKALQAPTKDEGFKEVFKVGLEQFQPRGSTEDVRLLTSFLTA